MLTLWLIVHTAWVVWMILGVLLAVLAHRKPRLWRMPVFRTAHLIGLLATATVPLWSDGICPITDWEWAADQRAPGEAEGFLVRAIRATLYLDVAPWILSIVTAVVAMYCVVVYVLYPPWHKPVRRTATVEN